MKSTPRWTWGPTLLWRQPATKPYSQEFIHPLILSPTPTYIGIEKQKNEENNAKKIEFVFHLVLLGIIKRKPRGTKPPGSSKPIQTQTFHSLLFSGSVLPLAIGANLSLLKNFVDFRKIEFRWWVGIDKLGWMEAQGYSTPTMWIKQVKRLQENYL